MTQSILGSERCAIRDKLYEIADDVIYEQDAIVVKLLADYWFDSALSREATDHTERLILAALEVDA